MSNIDVKKTLNRTTLVRRCPCMALPQRANRYGPTWAGNDMIKNFSYTKDYLGIIFPIAISAVGNSLMSLVSAKTAGTARYVNHLSIGLTHQRSGSFHDPRIRVTHMNLSCWTAIAYSLLGERRTIDKLYSACIYLRHSLRSGSQVTPTP